MERPRTSCDSRSPCHPVTLSPCQPLGAPMNLAYQIATPEVHTPDVTAYRGDLREGMRLVAESGFDGVELMLRDAAENDADAIAALAWEHGLEIAMGCTG